MSIFRCIASFSEAVSEAQDNLGVAEVVFEETPCFGTGGGPDAHKGLEDGVFHLSVVGSGADGVDGCCDSAARRRDRKGFAVFFRGGSVDGSSRGSLLRFSGVWAGAGGGLSFEAPPCRKGGWDTGPQTLGSSEILKYEGIVSLSRSGTRRSRGGVRGG